MRFAVRYFLVLVFLVISFLFLKSPVFAQSQTPLQPVNSYAAPNTNPDVPNNLHTWTQNVMIEVISAMTCQLAGVDPTNPSAKCLGVDQKTGKIGFVENGKGAIGVMGNLIAATFTPPIHTRDFVAYASRSFGIAKPSYAADESGINSISTITKTWVIFRDIVYTLFVLVFVVIGLAIMLRVRIDPRTVMTIQNQIPKIIIGLLLVTFSFAISGLLIDIMWITVYLFIYLAGMADPKMNPNIAGHLYESTIMFANYILGSNFFGGINDVANRASLGIGGLAFQLVGGHVPTDPIQVIGTVVNPASWVPLAIDLLFATIIGMITYLILVIAILWSMFRLWFALLEAYILILVDIVFAPLWIVGGLLPGNGQTVGFGAWLRDMLGNLSAFPVTIGMFLLGKLFMDSFGQPYKIGQFAPPLVGNPGDTNMLSAFIALGFIFTTPHVVKITKAAFKAPKIDLGPIGQAFGVGTRVVGAPVTLASQTFKQALVFQTGQWIGNRMNAIRGRA